MPQKEYNKKRVHKKVTPPTLLICSSKDEGKMITFNF